VHASCGGLEDYCSLVAQVVWNEMELGVMGDELAAPASAGSGAIPDLDAVADGSLEEVAEVVAISGSGAFEGRLLAPAGWSENGFESDPAAVGEGADDLVSGHEWERNEWLEVARRLTLNSGQVAATDAGEAGTYPLPLGSGELGWVDVLES